MTQYSPQELLDQVHQFGIPELFDASKSDAERKAEIRLYRE